MRKKEDDIRIENNTLSESIRNAHIIESEEFKKEINLMREKSDIQLEYMRNGHTQREDLNTQRFREELTAIKIEMQNNIDVLMKEKTYNNENFINEKKKDNENFINDMKNLHEKYEVDIKQYRLDIDNIKSQNIILISQMYEKNENEKKRILLETGASYTELQEKMKIQELDINMKNNKEIENLKFLSKNIEDMNLSQKNEIFVLVESQEELKILNSKLYELNYDLEDVRKNYQMQVCIYVYIYVDIPDML